MNAQPNIQALPTPKGAKRKKPSAVVRSHHKRGAQQSIAAVAAGFLPVASYAIAHIEAPEKPALYVLVAAALAYSAPTLSTWAERWTHDRWKAWAFTVLLEGVMVFSHLRYLNVTGLLILVAINAVTAFQRAAKL